MLQAQETMCQQIITNQTPSNTREVEAAITIIEGKWKPMILYNRA